jgi:hypothetical protein
VTCATGTCDFTGCAPGWDNCDGDKTNGCETQLGTDQNCSKCGDDCTGGQKCCPDKTCKGSCP